MQTKYAIAASAAFLVSSITSQGIADQGNWSSWFFNGDKPFDAIVGGITSDGSPMYICQAGNIGLPWAPYNIQGMHPGKVWGGCQIAYGNQGPLVKAYSVLVPAWQTASNGYVPPNATHTGGYDVDGSKLFHCRAGSPLGGLNPGKIRKDFGGCFIPFNSKELLVKNYDVLVDQIPPDGTSPLPVTTVTASFGSHPADALVAGYEADGTPLPFCLAAYTFVAGGTYYDYGTHPGQLKSDGCHISFDEAERIFWSYDVLVPNWTTYQSWESWRYSFPAGTDIGGIPLYACHGWVHDGFGWSVHPGKWRKDWNWCWVGYGPGLGTAQQIQQGSYNVLSK